MEIHVIPHFHECQSVMDISKLRLTSMTVEYFPVGEAKLDGGFLYGFAVPFHTQISFHNHCRDI